MRFLRQSGTIGSRLHVVACIRDIVYSSVLQSEHRTRYVNIPSICLLDWNYEAISYFFEQKIAALPSAYFQSRDDEKCLSKFLGIKSIKNESRGCTEEISRYLIRHTRCLPRDIIQIGNALAEDRLQYKSADQKSWVERIRATVSRMAATFADEQLQICANQLSSHEAPAFSARNDYSDLYTSNVEYINEKKKFVKQYISLIGRDIFSFYDIDAADEAVADLVPMGVKMSTILWQNGLIGTKQRGSRHFEFYSLGKNAGFSLPDNCSEYAFHSILIDIIPDMKISKGEPIQSVN